jgi:LmbE family N-acetylglucosaminyl deacetylase
VTRKIAVIAAHPDDETLGCGGTLLKHAAAGDTLHWLIATEATAPGFDDAFRRRRDDQIARVASAFGMARVHRLGFPTTELDRQPPADLIGRIGETLDRIGPDTVYIVHNGDVHADHRALFDAAFVALKPTRGPGPSEILSYETLSSTNLAGPQAPAFGPHYFVDISAYIDRKLEILSMYDTELLPWPHPRSLEGVRALALVRGAAIGVRYAEAFSVVRRRW